MNQHSKKIILILGSVGALLLLFLFASFFFGEKEGGAPEESPLPDLDASGPVSSLFQKEFLPPLSFDDAEYKSVRQDVEKTVSFPVLLPKKPSEFRLSRIAAWNEETEKLTALFRDNALSFTLQATTDLSPDSFGKANRTFELQNGGRAQAWVFENLTVLMFTSAQTEEGDLVWYLLESDTLAPEQLLDLANSIVVE